MQGTDGAAGFGLGPIRLLDDVGYGGSLDGVVDDIVLLVAVGEEDGLGSSWTSPSPCCAPCQVYLGDLKPLWVGETVLDIVLFCQG